MTNRGAGKLHPSLKTQHDDLTNEPNALSRTASQVAKQQRIYIASVAGAYLTVSSFTLRLPDLSAGTLTVVWKTLHDRYLSIENGLDRRIMMIYDRVRCRKVLERGPYSGGVRRARGVEGNKRGAVVSPLQCDLTSPRAVGRAG